MNKRLIALFLCLVMMLSVVLAGCAESSEEDAKNELEQAKVASNMTLTMWIVSKAPVSPEIRAEVTAAINALTRTKYKTQLDIQYLSEEEYFSKLTAAMEAYAANKKQQNGGTLVETGTTAEGEESTAQQIVTDEYGMYHDNYPDVLKNQVDIIYIGDVKDGEGNLLMSGEEMYKALRADDWLAPLDEAIKGDAKKIKEFVSPTLLSAVQEQGATYAIPNNNPIGKYTYMCLNKKLMDKYSLQGHLNRGSIKNFANDYIYQFIDQISRYENTVTVGEENPEKCLLPIDATYEECLAQLAYYWKIDLKDYSINSKEFSIFGTPLFDLQPNRGQNIVGVESLFENEEFTKHYLSLNEYRLEDMYRFVKNSDGTYSEDSGETPQEKEEKKIVFFRTDEEDQTEYGAYGIKFVEATLEKLNAKGNYVDENGVEYYVVPVSYPTAETEAIYGNMFAVARTTLSVDRSMQIITYLNTNSEIRNLLQYGVESKHYTVKETKNVDGDIVKSVELIPDKNGNKYEMNVYATGNAFLAHILYAEDATNYAIWANGKKQNRDSLVDPMLGFNLAEYALTATQFGIPVTVAATKPYKTTFRSGLNKDIFDDKDPVLEAWINECDEKEDGVYVFRSREKTINNEYSEVLYFYNTTGAYNFGVESVEESKEGGGYYRNNTYTYTVDDSMPKQLKNLKYTLTVVYDVCGVRYVNENGGYKVVQRTLKNGGEEDESARTECNYVETFNYRDTKYEFDLYDTNLYTMNIYGDLYLGDLYENAAVYAELKKLFELSSVKKNNKLEKQNLGLHWVDTESSEEKDYHTFFLCRTNMSVTTVMDVVPTLSADQNQLTLIVNYNEYDSKVIKNPEGFGVKGVRPGKTYLLYYITVETEKGVDVALDYNLFVTKDLGAPLFEYSSDNATVNKEIDKVQTLDGLVDLAEPIRFNPCGMLNTEIVQYMADLNKEIIGLLNACQDMEALKEMVGHLSKVLNTEERLFNLYTDFPGLQDGAFKNVVTNKDSLIYEGNFEELFYKLTHITNYGTMEEVQGELTRIGTPQDIDYDEYRPIFYSPYGIYYLWMEAYQYLPASMQTQKK